MNKKFRVPQQEARGQLQLKTLLRFFKNCLTQKQIKRAIKKYLPNHAICRFIEFLEKYGIKEKYLKNADLTEDNLILTLLKKPAIRYLDSVFYWKYTKEGYAYWEMIRTWWIEYIDKQEQRHST